MVNSKWFFGQQKVSVGVSNSIYDKSWTGL